MAVYTGKSIVVTGASSGIGRALCLALAPQRPRLVMAARDASRLEEVAAECRAAGAEVLVVPTDVTSPDECRRMVEHTVAAFGALDVLVNNAGASMMARFDEIEDIGLYERLMRVNYLGSVYPTYYALPHLKKSRGQIVVMSSLAGLTGVPTRTGYAASKHAVFGFFDSLRIELRGTGVSVTARRAVFRAFRDPPPLDGAGRQAAGEESHAGRQDHERGGVRRPQRAGDGRAGAARDHELARGPAEPAPPRVCAGGGGPPGRQGRARRPLIRHTPSACASRSTSSRSTLAAGSTT